ncbi:transglycosylase SLT domain-containing protein [Hydrogenovibrio sp. 3SP14C1]|uniref:lytic transglycosylase domain-containing protein n=1 Tax=Hydrogenovibrio sp. 3SP14C1 TaxID=3038774 RepID=UPI002417627D|nr:lytic transglycosylase domain-containing protein [Hydrogenovibrio sp. 3SP14C1]MDG4812378.1 transglycosylase SLT domain-containing protein [Hydrogenovibrio sp. 3SP14C1]
MHFAARIPKTLLVLCVSLSLSFNQAIASIDHAKLTDNQKKFLDAYEAIKANDRPLISKYKSQLKNYPLYPYLVYLDYKYHFKDTPSGVIESFLNNTPNSPLPFFLKSKWLHYLAETYQWDLYLKHYKEDEYRSVSLECYFIQASITRNRANQVQKKAQTLWKTHISLPKTCNPVKRFLRKEHLITGSMVWSKARLAMEKGKINQAKKIGRDLSKMGRRSLNFWIATYKTPKKVTRAIPAYISPVIRQAIFMQGIQRLSYSEPELALKTLTQRYEQYGLNPTELADLQSKISLRFAYQYHPKASEYLAQIERVSKNKRTLDWELQVAIRESNWIDYLDMYALLSEKQQNETRWRYWKARALDELNQTKKALPIFKLLAQQRNFYGFMSADRLNQPYQFNPTPSQKKSLTKMAQKYPQLKVIQELIAINWKLSLKREWYHLLDHIDKDDFEAIANFMSDWNQHNLAIQTISKVKKWDDLSLRFPTPYKQPVLQAADKNTIDPAWVYGVIRRESAFSANISSAVGAVGLMQLMPKTARYIGRKLGFKKRQYTHLTSPESNIKLGSAYLSYLHKKYNGSRVLATAAYNAGPHRVDQWIPKDTIMSADQWIETIPFSETRAYVKAVLEYTTIFKSMLNKKYDRLENFMHPIGLPKTLSAHKTNRKPQS